MPKKAKKTKKVKKAKKLSDNYLVSKNEIEDQLKEIGPEVPVSSETVRYIYNSMVRVEKKLDSYVTNNNKKISRSEAYATSGIIGTCMLFLSMFMNGHITPEELPNLIKAIFY